MDPADLFAIAPSLRAHYGVHSESPTPFVLSTPPAARTSPHSAPLEHVINSGVAERSHVIVANSLPANHATSRARQLAAVIACLEQISCHPLLVFVGFRRNGKLSCARLSRSPACLSSALAFCTTAPRPRSAPSDNDVQDGGGVRVGLEGDGWAVHAAATTQLHHDFVSVFRAEKGAQRLHVVTVLSGTDTPPLEQYVPRTAGAGMLIVCERRPRGGLPVGFKQHAYGVVRRVISQHNFSVVLFCDAGWCALGFRSAREFVQLALEPPAQLRQSFPLLESCTSVPLLFHRFAEQRASIESTTHLFSSCLSSATAVSHCPRKIHASASSTRSGSSESSSLPQKRRRQNSPNATRFESPERRAGESEASAQPTATSASAITAVDTASPSERRRLSDSGGGGEPGGMLPAAGSADLNASWASYLRATPARPETQLLACVRDAVVEATAGLATLVYDPLPSLLDLARSRGHSFVFFSLACAVRGRPCPRAWTVVVYLCFDGRFAPSQADLRRIESVVKTDPMELVAVNCGALSLMGVRHRPCSFVEGLCATTARLVCDLATAWQQTPLERWDCGATLSFGLHAVFSPCFARPHSSSEAPRLGDVYKTRAGQMRAFRVDLAAAGWVCQCLVHTFRAAEWPAVRKQALALRYQGEERNALWKRAACLCVPPE